MLRKKTAIIFFSIILCILPIVQSVENFSKDMLGASKAATSAMTETAGRREKFNGDPLRKCIAWAAAEDWKKVIVDYIGREREREIERERQI